MTLALAPRGIGLAFLLAAGIGLMMAACFRMDLVSTPRAQLSFSGKMHSICFLIGVPCQLPATLLLSLASGESELPRFDTATAAYNCYLDQPRRYDHGHGHGHGGTRKAAEPERAGRISRLAKPPVHGGLWSVVGGRSMADG